MIYAHLIQTQPASVIEFLSILDLDGRNGLECFLTIWLENYEFFQGYYQLKLK